MNTAEREALAVTLAGMEQECECWQSYSPEGVYQGHYPTCPDCHGTGKVLLFGDSVREPCPIDSHHGPRCLCAGRGWTASLDRRAWEPTISLALGNIGMVRTHWLDGQPAVHVVMFGARSSWIPDAERLLTALAQKEPGPCG